MTDTSGLLAPLTAFLAGPHFALGVAAGLLVAVLGWAIALALPRQRRRLAVLDRVTAGLRETHGLTDPERRLSAAEALFAATPLRGFWARFRAGLEIDERGVVATTAAEEVFAPDRVRRALQSGEHDLFDAILGLGLVAGVVGLAVSALVGGPGTPLRIEPLLPIAAVLVLTAARRAAARRLAEFEDRAVARLVDALATIASHVPRDLVAFRQLRASEEYDRQIARLRDELSGAIGSQIERVLSERTEKIPDLIAGKVAASVAGAVNPLVGEMMRIGTTMERTSSDFATRAGEGFIRIWREATHSETELMARSMRSTVEALEQVARTVQSVELGFGGTIELAGNRLLAATQRFGDMMDQRTSDLGVRLDSLKSSLSEVPGMVATATGEAVRSITARVIDLDAALARIPTTVSAATGEAVQALSTRIAGIDATLARIPETVLATTDRSLIAITSAVEETALRMQDCTRSFNETAAAEMERQAEQITIALGRAAERLIDSAERTSAELREAGYQLTGGVADGSRLVGESAEQVRATLAAAVEVLQQQVVELSARLGEASADLARQPERMGEAFETMWNGSVERQLQILVANVQSSSAALEAMNATVRSSESGYAATMASASGRLSEAAIRLQAAFETGGAGVSGQLDSLRAALADIPAQVAASTEDAVKVIGIAIADLDGGLARIPAAATAASTAALESVAARVGEIEVVLARLPTTMAAAAETAVGTIGASLSASAVDIQEQTRKIGLEMGETLGRRVEALGEAVSAVGVRLVDQADAAARLHATTADAVVAKLGTLEGVLGRLPVTVSETSEASIARITAAMDEAARRFGARSTEFADRAGERLETLAANLAATGAELVGQTESAASAQRAAADAVVGRLRELEGVLERLPDRMATASDGAVARIGAGMGTAVQDFELRTRSFANTMAEVLNTRAAALGEVLQAAAQDFAQTSHRSAEAQSAAADGLVVRIRDLEAAVGALPDVVAAAAAEIGTRVGHALDAGAEAVGRRNAEMSDRAATAFEARITVIGSALESAGRRVNEDVENLAGRLREAGDQLNGGAVEGVRLAGKAADLLRSQFAETIGELRRQVEELSARLEAASGDLARQPEIMARSFSKVWDEAVGRQVGALTDTVGDSVEALQAVTATLSEADRSFGETVHEAARKLAMTSSTLDDALQGHHGRVAGHLAAMETVLERMPTVVDVSTQSAVRSIDRCVTQLDETLERLPGMIVGSTTGAIKVLKEAIDDIDVTLRRVPTTVASVTDGSIAAIGQGVAAVVGDLREQNREMAGNLRTEIAGLVAAVDAAGGSITAAATSAGNSLEGAGRQMGERTAAHLDLVGAASEAARVRIEQAVEGLGKQVERLSNRLEIASADLVRQPERMSETFGALWKASASAHIDTLAETVRTATDTLEQVAKAAKESSEGFGSGVDRAAARLEEAVHMLDGALATGRTDLREQIATIAGVVQSIPPTVLGSIEDLTRAIRARTGDLDSALTAMPARVSEAADQAVARLTEGLVGIEKVLAEVPLATGAATEKALAAITVGVDAMSRNVQEVGRDFSRATVAEFEAKVRSLSDVLREAGDTMVVAVRSSGDELRRSGGALRDGFAEGLGESIGRIAATAERAVEQLNGVVRDLDEKFNRLGTRIDGTAGLIDRTSREIEMASRSISETSGSLGTVARAVEATSEPLTASVLATREALDQVLRGLATITNANQRGAEAIEAVTAGGTAAQEFFQAQGLRIGDLDAVITTTLEQLRDSMRRLSTEITTELRVIANINREDVQDFLQSLDERLSETLERTPNYMR